MSKNSFLKEAMYENHPQYQQAISRNEALYQRKNDLRSPFSRDVYKRQLQHLKKQKKALFQKLKVFSMMKENNLKN